MQLFLVSTKRHANNHTDIHYKQTTEAEYLLGARDTKSLGIDTSSLFSFLVLIDKRTKMYQLQNLSC